MKIVLAIVLMGVSTTRAAEHTLDSLVSAAIKNSKQVQSVHKEIEKAQSQVKEAIGNGMPTIKGSDNYRYGELYSLFTSAGTQVDTAKMNSELRNQPRNFPAPLNATEPAISGKILGHLQDMFEIFTEKNAFSLNLSLDQQLSAQSKIGLGWKIAKSYSSSHLYKLLDQELNIKNAVTKHFNSAMLTKINVSIQIDAVKLAKKHIGLQCSAGG